MQEIDEEVRLHHAEFKDFMDEWEKKHCHILKKREDLTIKRIAVRKKRLELQRLRALLDPHFSASFTCGLWIRRMCKICVIINTCVRVGYPNERSRVTGIKSEKEVLLF
jgi:hypothetical protein